MKDYQLLDIIMEEIEEGHYNGENDILPWTFCADDVTPLEVLIMIRAWNGEGKVWSFSDCKNEDSIKGGYTYIVEYQRIVYSIEINNNMGLWAISKIYEMEKQF